MWNKLGVSICKLWCLKTSWKCPTETAPLLIATHRGACYLARLLEQGVAHITPDHILRGRCKVTFLGKMRKPINWNEQRANGQSFPILGAGWTQHIIIMADTVPFRSIRRGPRVWKFWKFMNSDLESGAKNEVKPYFLIPMWRVTGESNEMVQYIFREGAIVVCEIRLLITKGLRTKHTGKMSK